MVQGNKGSDEGWKLEYAKPIGAANSVKITKKEWDMGTDQWKIILVGYIPGMNPKFREIANYVNNRWKDIQIPRVHMRKFGVLLFHFQSYEKMGEILNTRWFVQGKPLILKPWRPEMDLEDMRTDSVPVWVKFPDLHFSLWNPVALGKIASYLETPIKTDKLTAVKGKLEYARMLIDIKIADSIPQYVEIEGSNDMLKQRVEYEWKPVKCGLCKSHESEQCRKNDT